MWRSLLLCSALILSVASAGSAAVTISVQPFPPNAKLQPGTSAVITVEGLEPGQETAWHRIPQVDGDLVLSFSDERGRPVLLFTGSAAGHRTFLLQLAKDGLDELVQCDFVYGAGPDPEPDPDPGPDPDPQPVPPLTDLAVTIVEERDQTAQEGIEGARSANRMTEVLLFLSGLPVRFEVHDDDQPAAARCVEHLQQSGIEQRPAWLVRVPGQQRVIATGAFAKDAAGTIAALNEALGRSRKEKD